MLTLGWIVTTAPELHPVPVTNPILPAWLLRAARRLRGRVRWPHIARSERMLPKPRTLRTVAAM
jgi:hypothetical protein